MLSHIHKVRVYWGDCDPARIVFYPRFFQWIDEASHELMEKGGLEQVFLQEHFGLRGTVLADVSAQFKLPVYFGDNIEVHANVGKLGRATFEIGHEVRRDDTVVAVLKELRVWAMDDPSSPTGVKAGTIPDEVRAVFEGKVARLEV